jgi:transposase-like protein
MDPHQQWCHNPHCRAYGRVGEGHIVIHSQKERRYRCKRCCRTFSATKDTALYRMHKPKWLVLTVVTLLAYGCPVQAIVAAFSLDERTVARWQRKAGLQAKRVHEHLIEAGRVQLLQVQADEIHVKAVGGIFWLACAMEVRSRLGWAASLVRAATEG